MHFPSIPLVLVHIHFRTTVPLLGMSYINPPTAIGMKFMKLEIGDTNFDINNHERNKILIS